MCMTGRIQPVVGEVCSICSSTVERILKVTPGGAPNPTRKRRDRPPRLAHQDAGYTGSGVTFSIREKTVHNHDGTFCERGGAVYLPHRTFQCVALASCLRLSSTLPS
jgi:hypothetical protein